MRGLKPIERAVTDGVLASGPCQGSVGTLGRPYGADEMKAIDDLIMQGRAVLKLCGCGKRHVELTPAGLEARRLDALAHVLPMV